MAQALKLLLLAFLLLPWASRAEPTDAHLLIRMVTPWQLPEVWVRAVTDPTLAPALANEVVSRLVRMEGDPAERADLASSLAALPMPRGARASLLRDLRDPEVRAGIVVSTSGAPRAEAESLLLLVMSEKDATLRLLAVAVAGRHPRGPLVPVLLQGLFDEDPAIRAEAARVMGWWRLEVARGALEGLLRDEDVMVRRRASAALARFD